MDKKLEIIALLTEELEVAESKLEDKQDEVNTLRRKFKHEQGLEDDQLNGRVTSLHKHFAIDTAQVPKVLTKNRKKYLERVKRKIMRGRLT